MKLVRNWIDRTRKLYHEPGSPLHKVWPLLDALDTFLFTPDTTTPRHGPHVRDYIDLKRVMWLVIFALLPCLAWSIFATGYLHFQALAHAPSLGGGEHAAYHAGWLQKLLFGAGYAPDVAHPGFFDQIVFGLDQMIPILIVSYGVGLGIEGLFAVLRKEEISEGYLVTGMLVALIVPASIPLWQLAIAVAFSVVLAKEIFGGTGMNIFNPALVVRAFLFFAYPAQISGDAVWVAGNGARNLIDGYSGATPLLAAAAAPGGHAAQAVRDAGYTIWDMILGLIPGSAGETSKIAVLFGAVVLIATGVGSWRTMAACVVGLLGTAFLVNITLADYKGIASLPFWEHLLVGGFLFGTVFMATDPVSSPETEKGRWIYGILIGFVTVLVRAINPAYPEGVMLAILLMNAFAPTIDHFVVAANMRRRRLRLG